MWVKCRVTTFAQQNPTPTQQKTRSNAEQPRFTTNQHTNGKSSALCVAECHCMLIASNAYEVVISAAMATVCPHAITGYATAKIAKFTNTANIKNGKQAAMQPICRFIWPVGAFQSHRR